MHRKPILSIFLSVLLVFSITPASAWADWVDGEIVAEKPEHLVFEEFFEALVDENQSVLIDENPSQSVLINEDPDQNASIDEGSSQSEPIDETKDSNETETAFNLLEPIIEEAFLAITDAYLEIVAVENTGLLALFSEAITPKITIAQSIEYNRDADDETLRVTLSFSGIAASDLKTFLEGFDPADELIVFRQNDTVTALTSADLLSEAITSSLILRSVTREFDVYSPCTVTIQADLFSDSSGDPFVARTIYKKLSNLNLISSDSVPFTRILGEGVTLSSAGIYAAEVRHTDGTVIRRFPAAGAITANQNLNIGSYFTGLGYGLSNMNTYITLSSNTIAGIRSTEAVASGGDLLFTIRCIDDQGTIYEFTVMVVKAVLETDWEGKIITIPFGADIQQFVNSEDFVNTHVTLDSSQILFSKTVYELLNPTSSSHRLFSWSEAQYPDPGDTLDLDRNSGYPTSADIDASAVSGFSATIEMDIDERPDMWEMVWYEESPDNWIKAYIDENNIAWVNSILVKLKYISDSGEIYQFGTALSQTGAITAPIDPDDLIRFDLIGNKDDSNGLVYAKNTSSEKVYYLDKIRCDETPPSLVGISIEPRIAPGEEHYRNGYLGYDPNDPDWLENPLLVLEIGDSVSGVKGSGPSSYILTYRGSVYSSGTVESTGTFDSSTGIWTIKIELEGENVIYELADFILELTDFVGNKSEPEVLPWDDESINPDKIKGVIISSGDLNVKYWLQPNAVGYTNSYLTVNITVDDFTIRVLEKTDPTITVATIQTDTGNISVRISDFSALPDSDDMRVYTLPLLDDGVYAVTIAFTDFLGHTFFEQHPEFVIDTRAPIVWVTFDNNDVRSGNYYNAPRTATIRVFEKNFNSAGVDVRITATNNAGQPATAPTLSGWSIGENGENTATVYFGEELHYSMEVYVTDLARNDGDPYPFEVSEFIIDMTPPVITISGLTNTQAYAGEIQPVITFMDAHFDDYQAQVSFVLANGGQTYAFRQNSVHEGMTKTVNIENLSHTPNNDNVYIMTATITDRAGNSATESVMFSINRFGSTYLISAPTSSLIGTYLSAPKDIVVTEINPSGLKDGETILRMSRNLSYTETLELGKGYRVEPGFTTELWSSYIYTIPASSFTADGHYYLIVRSIDLADNLSENTMDNKNYDRTAKAEIYFSLDTTPPTGAILNVDEGETHISSQHDVYLQIEDNMGWDYALLFINGQEVKRFDAQGEELSSLFTYSLTESKDDYNIELVVFDKAGHKSSTKKTGIMITSSPVAQVTGDPVLFNGLVVGVIIAVVATTSLFFFFIGRKRKRDNEKVVFSKTGNR